MLPRRAAERARSWTERTTDPHDVVRWLTLLQIDPIDPIAAIAAIAPNADPVA